MSKINSGLAGIINEIEQCDNIGLLRERNWIDHRTVQWAVAKRLAALNTPESRTALRQCFGSDIYAELRIGVTQYFTNCGNIETIKFAIRGGDPRIRLCALDALREILISDSAKRDAAIAVLIDAARRDLANDYRKMEFDTRDAALEILAEYYDE